MRVHLYAILVATLLVAPPMAMAQQQIKAPFGMQWGETLDRITEVVSKAKAKIAGVNTVGNREALAVDGIVQEGLKRTIFYFSEGGLNEVELQYDREDWDEPRVASWVTTIKQQADRKYGPGRLFADERGEKDGIQHTLRGWIWVQGFVSLRLVHYTAQKGQKRMRRISLHYCNG